jgi:hypothetical protein
MASRSSPKLNSAAQATGLGQPKRIDPMPDIAEACARFASVLGDNPVAIAAAVKAEMEAVDPRSAEKQKAIEDVLSQNHYIRRPSHLM